MERCLCLCWCGLGGISFFATEGGFGCDNVLGYEVVLGNGTIVEASHDRNRDLFMALKGVRILPHFKRFRS